MLPSLTLPIGLSLDDLPGDSLKKVASKIECPEVLRIPFEIPMRDSATPFSWVRIQFTEMFLQIALGERSFIPLMSLFDGRAEVIFRPTSKRVSVARTSGRYGYPPNVTTTTSSVMTPMTSFIVEAMRSGEASNKEHDQRELLDAGVELVNFVLERYPGHRPPRFAAVGWELEVSTQTTTKTMTRRGFVNVCVVSSVSPLRHVCRTIRDGIDADS